ncbi:hypothetical protein PCANB_002609 [Pneumocystis canis]|nr:hypothetical protein PCANB_002609 [Pneumocystis canis]
MSRLLISKEKVEFNGEVLKTLLKLPGNKYCSDCKRNDHPRWASWSLGVFLCIRCSGIHRSMGTHISRVKSVDLDAWTDEQLENMIRWGNSRANKYWEAKLIPGHIPSESKIDNYIRTKYEAKRWVMDGPIPDPSTLDEEDVNETLHTLLDHNNSDKKQNSTITSKNLISQINVKNQQISNNSSCSQEQKNKVLCHSRNSSFSQGSVKSKSSSFKSNFKNCTSISKSHLSSEVPIKSSETDLKASILSLYSTIPTFQLNHSTNDSVTNSSSLHEDISVSKYEQEPSNSVNTISDDLQNLNFSENQEKLHSSESSRKFSNPVVSYLLNTQKIPPVFTSFDASKTKNQESDENHKHTTEFTKDAFSSNGVFDLENVYIKDSTTELPRIFADSTSDLSIQQWDNESLAFNSFQSSSPFFASSDLLSFYVSPWSTDKPKETDHDFNDYKTNILHKQDFHDKSSPFYDNSIISTTDVWK